MQYTLSSIVRICSRSWWHTRTLCEVLLFSRILHRILALKLSNQSVIAIVQTIVIATIITITIIHTFPSRSCTHTSRKRKNKKQVNTTHIKLIRIFLMMYSIIIFCCCCWCLQKIKSFFPVHLWQLYLAFLWGEMQIHCKGIPHAHTFE